ncbi:MAG: SRPBCC family protein [Nocardioidaceae bacterium]
MRRTTKAALTVTGGLAAGAAGYLGLVSGAVPVDLGVGRRTRGLGPLSMDIAAPREVVFEVLSAPYAERAPRALREKVQILERGHDLLLAEHFTPITGGLTATTVETVRFSRPERIDFRLVRGPVPHVVETIGLAETEAGTRMSYVGELGTDLWGLGQRWGDIVARRWNHAVARSFDTVKLEAERRASR